MRVFNFYFSTGCLVFVAYFFLDVVDVFYCFELGLTLKRDVQLVCLFWLSCLFLDLLRLNCIILSSLLGLVIPPEDTVSYLRLVTD